MARAAIRRHGPVQLRDVADVDDTDWVVCPAMIGSPTVMMERLPSGREAATAARSLAQAMGVRFDAIMPIEAGGLNSTIPLALCAEMGLPLVDADGMGRAFPEVQMVTFGAGGGHAWPMTLVNELGESVLIDGCADNTSAERLARATAVAMGGAAISAHWPLRGEMIKTWGVAHSVTKAINIGRVLREQGGSDRLAALGEVCGARLLVSGKVVGVNRSAVGGFVRGTLAIRGLDADEGVEAEVVFQNENILLSRDGEVQVTVPDIISLVDAETWLPLTTERVRYGLRVAVLGIPCSDIWWRPEALELVSPRAFGHDLDVRSLGESL